MKLNSDTKRDVRIGDMIRFNYGDAYYVTGVLESARGGISFALQDVQTKQTIYAYPSSQCYGAEIIKSDRKD